MIEFLGALWERLAKEIAQAQKRLRKFSARAREALPSLLENHQKIERVRSAVDESGPGLWLTIKHNPHPPSTIDALQKTGKLILTVANLKGGVGKTTLTANLAAFFANPFNDSTRPSRKVLVVDLDFQGSCSSMLFADTEWRPGKDQLSHASELVTGSPMAMGGHVGQPVSTVNGARGISAFYDLASVENREMIRWLMGDEKNDIRYRLAHTLLNNAVLDHFDVILIDAPPRLTTASIQALCASTHVLIPTVLDPLSTDAVGYFGRQLKAHEILWPQLKVMGIIGTLTNTLQRGEEEPFLTGAGDRLRDALMGSGGCLRYLESKKTDFEFPYEWSVRRSTPLARAASQGVPYVMVGNSGPARLVRKMFDNFGREVERRWHL